MGMELTVGAVAYDPKVVTIWELIRDVTAGAPAHIDYVLYSTYEALVEALLAGAVDLAWNTNTAFVRTYLRTQGRCRGLVMRDTDRGYTSKLIAPVDSGIARLEDLRGKRVAFGSRDSGHAAILPAYYLRQAGLEAGRDYRAVPFDLDVGKHGDTGASEGAVLDAVRKGTADVGFVGDPFWLRALATGTVDERELEAVWTSPPYSHCTFTALSTLSEAAAQTFVETFVHMDPADPRVRRMMDLEGLRAWVPTELSGYGDLIAAMSGSGRDGLG
ncbi:MAG: PhnD/SsuA/transferrin family substrate-binding protein [Firmicutes bacterium]|nr:PhnD/SsuA/transferrin family substrate-binding protein [Alicyclobacillaceae bacterium]MCL6497769.1 PhnD/SsuA/transferrin family substrate-binding protein [Bacillota bacterium]